MTKRKRRKYRHQRVPEGADSWVCLAVWVFIRAVWDANGEKIHGYRGKDKEARIRAAQEWLESEDALIFLDRYNIEREAMIEAMGL